MWSSWKSHLLGIGIRMWMFKSGFHDSLSDRVEISTPINSWKRGNFNFKLLSFNFIQKFILLVVEGVHLMQRSQSPYEGDIFHETPTNLFFYSRLLLLNTVTLQSVFVLCDLLTAVTLAKAASLFYRETVKILHFSHIFSTFLKTDCKNR